MLSQDKCQFSSEYLTYFKELYFHHYSSDWNFANYTCFRFVRKHFQNFTHVIKGTRSILALADLEVSLVCPLVWTKLFQRVILDIPLSLVTIECCALIISWNLIGLNWKVRTFDIC